MIPQKQTLPVAGIARTWNDLANALSDAMERVPLIDYIEIPENPRNGYQYGTQARMERLKIRDAPWSFAHWKKR